MKILDKFKLDGYCSMITGGAKGLGKTMATGLAQAGSNIVIADIDLENAEITAKEIKDEYGVDALALKVDTTKPDEAATAAAKTVEKFGKIDVLLNNSGIWRCEEAEKMSWENWYDVINVNLNGTFLMSQAVGREMIKMKKGSIINIASISGELVNDPPYKCSYNASKAGVMMLTKALAAEWARYNIRVNSISPGTMKYEVLKTIPELKSKFELYPMNRWGYSEELCGMLVYLASEASSFVTGAVYTVDGGCTIWKGAKPFPQV